MKSKFVKHIFYLSFIPSLICLSITAHAQKVIPLYSGSAPGSESWTHNEKEYFSRIWNTQVVTNVSRPTLTAWLPDPAIATGASVIICPGGGFHALSINSEGNDVAKWLNGIGVAAFVLKYRLVPTGEDGVMEMMTRMSNPNGMNESIAKVVPLAIADGMAAVRYVRQNAKEFGIASDRIGLMGFSAGGTVTASVALNYNAESRPDFVAPVYAFMGAVKETPLPKDAPPLFVVAATDDQLGLAPDSIRLYNQWLLAKKSAEIHMYSKGGHGFGMRQQNLPSDRWIELFGEWLMVQGLLSKK